MSMSDASEKLRAECKELFKDGLTFRQLWWVVKMMKAARMYCRTNVALNNFMNMTFKGIAIFNKIEKEDFGGKKYMALSITMLKPDGTAGEIITDTEE